MVIMMITNCLLCSCSGPSQTGPETESDDDSVPGAATSKDSDSESDKTEDENTPDTVSALELTPSDGKKLRIACIGDSITYGYSTTDPSVYSWPAQLQKKLGTEKVLVGNFGKSSSYAMDADDKYNVRDKALTYRATKEYKDSLKFGADIVIIKLGINDCNNLSCKQACDNLKAALVSLAREYASLPTVQRVYIATSIRVSITARVEQLTDGPLQEIQKAAAEEADVYLMDVYGLTRDYYDFMIHYTNDRLHPGNTTLTAIANATYSVLSNTAYVQPKINTTPGNVVYVSANGQKTNDGSTPQKAVSSLGVAVGLLREKGGTIVLSGDYTVVSETHLPENHEPIKITSVHNGINYDTKIIMKNSLYMRGDIKFENVEFNIAATGIMFVCNYNNVHFASGIECTLAAGITQYPLVLAGVNVASGGIPIEEISLRGNCNITIDSGTWLYIRSGNRRTHVSQPFGNIEADATLTVTVNVGRFTNKATSYMSCATGMNSVEGKCVLIINGGEFLGNVYGISRVGTSSDGSVGKINGVVEVRLNGGNVHGSLNGVMDSTASFNGKCILYLGNDMHSYESKASGFTSVVKE